MFSSIEYVDGEYPRIVFIREATQDNPVREMHDIPMQAIADRMELYGLESVEQVLEYIGLEAHNSAVSDLLHSGIQEAYRDVVQSEFAQTLMPSPRVDQPSTRQTLMAPMSISAAKRENLAVCRTNNLHQLGMRSVLHSEPARLMHASDRPVQRTVPAAAEALRAQETVVQQAVALVQEHADVLENWRVETLVQHVPQMRTFLAGDTVSEVADVVRQ